MATNRARRGDSLFAPATLRRHWKPLVALLLASTLIGGLIGLIRPPVHTAEIRLAVGNSEMSNLNIPGYPTASAQMAANYARWVTNRGAGGTDVPEGTLTLTSSPLPESNVLRIEAEANDPEVALRAVTQASDALRKAVNQVADENNPDKILQQINKSGPDVAAKQVDNSVAEIRYKNAISQGRDNKTLLRLRQAFIDSQVAYVDAQVRQGALQDRYRRIVAQDSSEAELHTVGQGAELTKNDRVSFAQRLGLLGLAVGAGLGVAFLWWRERHQPDSAVPADDDVVLTHDVESAARDDFDGFPRRGAAPDTNQTR